jgi:hypothetical protein
VVRFADTQRLSIPWRAFFAPILKIKHEKNFKKNGSAFLIPCVLCLLNASQCARSGQKAAPEQLLTTLSKIDSALFASFNHCDIQQFRTFFAEDLEFYHDKGGSYIYHEEIYDDFANGLCKPGNAWKSRRELVPVA